MPKPATTFCRICEAACGLKAHYDPEGELVGLRPDREHPTSRGYACAKGTRFLEVARHPSRLRHPVLDGEQVSWDYATAVSAQRLRAVLDDHGPHAVGVYFGNPLAFNALGVTAMLGLVKALGTRNVFYAGSQDCNNKFAGARIVHGSEVIHPLPDFGKTDFALVFGSNPYISQSSFIHLEGGSARAFGDIVERGGSIVWVDPRRTESARRWGEHLPIRPGTDAWLMLGLLHLLRDLEPPAGKVEGLDELRRAAASIELGVVSAHTGISVPTIERLAEKIRGARSVAMHMSVGVNQGGHGTLCYVLMQALAFLTGNLDREGGSLFSPLARRLSTFYRMAGLDRVEHSRVGDFRSTFYALPGGIMADEILTPGPEKIRALLVIAGDPLRSIPGASRLRQALPQLEFLACIDMFKSQTGEFADVLLPAASWLERWDVAIPSIPFQRTSLMQVAGPLLPLQHEARTDAKIISDLALAMGLPGLRWRVATLGLDRWLPRPRHGFNGLRPRPGRYLARSRLRFWDPAFAGEIEAMRRPPAEPERFLLIGRRRRLGHNSWLHGGVRDGDPEPHAWLGPEQMAELGLEDGDEIEIRSEAGALRIAVRAQEGLAERTGVVPHGVPGWNVNEIIPAGPANIERLSGQLTMTGIPAQIERVARASPAATEAAQ